MATKKTKTTRAQGKPATIELDLERIEDSIVEQCKYEVDHDKIREMIRDAIGKHVDAAVKSIGPGIVEGEIRAQVANGWVQTDQWGSAKKTVTLREWIREFLDHNTAGYNQPTRTRLQTIVAEQVTEAVKSGFAEEMTAARKRFADAVDAVISTKLHETLKSALGLK